MNDIKEDNIMITKDQIIKVIDYAGMTNINMYPKVSERQRRQFSTKAYYYDQGGEVEWNHEFFDMYGLGKVIEYIFAPKQCLESVPKQTQIMILDAV